MSSGLLPNVLLLSAGRRVSLLRTFQEAVRRLELPGTVLTADMRPALSAACQLADRALVLPHVLAPEYPETLVELCREEGIGLVIPTIDTELAVLAGLRERLAERGTSVVVSSADLVRRCRDKRLTTGLFEAIGLPTPRLYRAGAVEFPLFAKPISGSMSQGIRIFSNAREFESSGLDLEATLLMEVISPRDWEEVTVDAFYDRKGSLKCLVPRRRSEVRGGEIAKGWTDKSLVPALRGPLDKISGARGCLTIQVFARREGEGLLGIEINPRFGGGYPLSHRAGADYSEWLLREHMLGQHLPYDDSWEDRLMMLRYDAEVWTRFEQA